MVKRADGYVSPETMDESVSRWIGDLSGYTHARPDLVIDPGKCALIVIDMLHYFAHPEGRAYLPATRAAVPRIGRLLTCWRERRAPVMFTRHCHKDEKELGMLGRFFADHIRCGSPEADFLPELSPLPGEEVVRKSTYDAFHGTDLETLLVQSGCGQVLITGVLTHLCCETTARSAFVRGFEVYFAADGTAANNEILHLGSLRALAHGVAVVMSTDKIIRICAAKR